MFDITILIAVLVFGLMIFVHELGHFLAAKACNIRVNEFAIGMGPRIAGFTKGETKYSIRLLPIGGYLAMEGEDAESDDLRAFYKYPVYKRMFVCVAGAAMNILCGFIILLILMSPVTMVRDSVLEGLASEWNGSAQGILPGDEIVRINGERVYLYGDVTLLLDRYSDTTYSVVVKRDNKLVKIDNVSLKRGTFTFNGKAEKGKYGIVFVQPKPAGVGDKINYAFRTAQNMGRLVRMGLVDMVTGRAKIQELSGPVGIAGQLSTAAKTSFADLFWLVAFISINLGIVNLLPLPALDGGRLIFQIIELIRRKPIKPKYEGYVHAAGFVLLLSLMAFVTFNDIRQFFV